VSELARALEAVGRALSVPLLQLGESALTLWTLLYLVGLVVGLAILTRLLRRWIANRLLARTRMDVGARQAVGTITAYLVFVVGLLVVLQTSGIDLTTLNILAGAVGIGVGFGLQNVISNFISGLIILFERPIKVGDRIEVGNVEGDVVRIGARSTTVVTNDNIAIIVPNSKVITENVVNWSHIGGRVRFRIPVSVAYGTDPRLVERLLLEVAAANPDVLADPAPGVRLLAFGEDGLHFELRAWSSTLLHRRGRLTSALNFAILEAFTRHGVEIPFPQRDVRIRGGRLEILKPPDPA
jgi:small-conductance mechanosensitive channel